MAVPDELMEILRCIECHSQLDQRDAELVCRECGLHFPVEGDIPVMLPESSYRPEGP